MIVVYDKYIISLFTRHFHYFSELVHMCGQIENFCPLLLTRLQLSLIHIYRVTDVAQSHSSEDSVEEEQEGGRLKCPEEMK